MTKYTKEELEQYILIDKLSYEAIGRKYGISGAAIRKAARKFGIPLEPKRKINPCETFNKGVKLKDKEERYCLNCGQVLDYYQNKYCSSKCQQDYEYKEYISKWKSGEISGTIKNNEMSCYIRRYILNKYDNRCQLCGWDRKNPITGKSPLHIHHIDGDCSNNAEENLQLLCPNCHSLTENFGNLNKDSKRYNYIRNKIMED